MNTTRPLALVTGASSGIGAELAVELAHKGHDLYLTGRDAGKLAEVAGRVRAAGAQAETLSLDLGSPTGVATLVQALGDRSLAVLVNNAGFGDWSPVATANPATLTAMIHLNVTVLTQLTQAFLPGMIARKTGRVLLVGSTGSFSPVPNMAVYAATKAYVLSFGDAVAEELVDTGVTLTTLCPGATTTQFAARADVKSKGFKDAMSAEAVAQQGVKGLLAGKRIVITGTKNVLMAFSTRLAPRSLAAKIAKKMMARDES